MWRAISNFYMEHQWKSLIKRGRDEGQDEQERRDVTFLKNQKDLVRININSSEGSNKVKSELNLGK